MTALAEDAVLDLDYPPIIIPADAPKYTTAWLLSLDGSVASGARYHHGSTSDAARLAVARKWHADAHGETVFFIYHWLRLFEAQAEARKAHMPPPPQTWRVPDWKPVKELRSTLNDSNDKKPTWIKDDNGNRCSVEYFGSESAAKTALASLIDCCNCENCARCARCSDCSDCSDCWGCSLCSRCSDCSDCWGCSDCSDCSDCSACSFCSRCSRCSACSFCSRCSDCSLCTDEAHLVARREGAAQSSGVHA